MSNFPIGRITVIHKSNKVNYREKKLVPLFKELGKTLTNNVNIEVLLTPAGFLRFDLPKNLIEGVKVDSITKNQLQLILNVASEKVFGFFKQIDQADFKKLKDATEIIAVGIDGNCVFGSLRRKIELIAMFNPNKSEITHWTGKFYPMSTEENRLIRFPDLKNHFMVLNNRKVMILECHDLNIFNPRNKEAILGWRKDTYEKFLDLSRKNKPELVIQLPHETDNPRTWLNGWKGMEKHLPTVKNYASSILTINEKYLAWFHEDILKSTKKGDVFEFAFSV